MGRVPILLIAAVAAARSLSAPAAEPDLEKLRARCIDVAALVYGPADAKEPKPLAGALVLDTGKRLLLTRDRDVPDALTVVFPAYTAKGELRNKPADYTELWKKGERWAGKVLHRDKERDLAVIELDRALPDRARAAEFRAKSALVASPIYALHKTADGDKMWELHKGEVSAIVTERFLSTDPYLPPRRIMSTASRGTGPDCGLFDKEARVAGFASPPELRDVLVHSWLEVTEVRAFLTDKKVPFQTIPDEPDLEKLRARCIDVAALVYGSADAREPKPLAGALVLDTGKRLLLTRDTDVPDAPTVVFPAYSAKGELRNKPADYTELWKKGERWAGKVLHRDKERDLAVIELDRALPDRARAADVAERRVRVAATVYTLARLSSDHEIVWEFAEGEVHAVGKERLLFTGSGPPPEDPKIQVVTTPLRSPDPAFGLFDGTGRMVGFPLLHRSATLVSHWLDVTDVRSFLTEKRVPFQTVPDESDLEKLRARCIDVAALVYGPADAKEPKLLAGALVLDTGKRLLLTRDTDVPDAPTVVFPAYAAKGELRNKPADYADLWKKGERWAGKVLHRDKELDLAVIELDRALPERARAAEFRAKSVGFASTVYALHKRADEDTMWALHKGEVSAIGVEPFLAPRSYPPKGPKRITVTAPQRAGPDCGLFDKDGRVAGFASPPESGDFLVHSWLDVTEVRAFLTDKKVPFRTAPDEKATDAKAK